VKLGNFLKLFLAVVLSLSAGAIGSLFTAPAIQSGWYEMLTKPMLNPPSWVFGPVWTLLYVLMGVSFFIVWKNNFEVRNNIWQKYEKAWNKWSERLWRGDLQKANVILIFFFQLALNALWSLLFFGLRSPGIAFFGILALWAAIFYTIVNFYRTSKPAAYLLFPYILWVSFAAYLNVSIWVLN
jgi:translocator protein